MEFIKGTYKDFDKLKDIYKEAFPYTERKPVCMQKSKIKKGIYDLHILMENDEVLGFITSYKYEDLVMLDYLAVNGKIRSKGIGSEILQRAVETYKDYRVCLMCESLDDSADNNEQRKKRKKFYYKNGFHETGIVVNGISGRMDIMMQKGTMVKDEYMKLQTVAIGKFLIWYGNIHVESF